LRSKIIFFLSLLILLSYFVSACAGETSTEIADVTISASTPINTSMDKLTNTLTVTLSSSPTTTPTPSPTPTISPTPTPSPTHIGGGSGMFKINVKGSVFIYSLDDRSMDLEVKSPELNLEYIDDAKNLMRLVLDEGIDNNKILYECPIDDYICYVRVLADNPDDERVYLNVEHRQQEYCPCTQELIRVNTITSEQNVLEQSTGSVGFDLMIYPESSKWLLTDNWARGFYSDLFIYNPETQEKQLVITRQGAFSQFGYAPDYSFIWYRITDYCKVEIVREDGSQIPGFDNADSILGWINEEQFLIITANNHPPICSLTGVAVANIYGLGDWLLRGNIGQILLSPDQSKLIYTDDCSNSVCKSLKMLDLNNRETEILYESDIFWIKE
jgi:hypothetical protein